MQFGLLGDGIILLLLLRGGMGIEIGRLEGAGEGKGAVYIVVRDEVEVEETLAIGGRHCCDAEEQQMSSKSKQEGTANSFDEEEKGNEAGGQPRKEGMDDTCEHAEFPRSP